MTILHMTLISATLLCSLVAGLVFVFAVVAMPGLGTLGDRDFLRAFQVIDRVIQNNHPLFILVWGGSVVALIAGAVLGMQELSGLDRGLLLGALGIYLLGVQGPTLAVNVPLNNQLQTVDLKIAEEVTVADARQAFEARWNLWNRIRTIFAIVTSCLMLILLVRL